MFLRLDLRSFQKRGSMDGFNLTKYRPISVTLGKLDFSKTNLSFTLAEIGI